MVIKNYNNENYNNENYHGLTDMAYHIASQIIRLTIFNHHFLFSNVQSPYLCRKL